MTIQLTSLTSASSLTSQGRGASVSGNHVQSASSSGDAHHFGQSLSKAGSTGDRHLTHTAENTQDTMEKSNGELTNAHAAQESENHLSQEMTDNTLLAEHADLTQQIAQWLHTQPMVSPPGLRHGFLGLGAVDHASVGGNSINRDAKIQAGIPSLLNRSAHYNDPYLMAGSSVHDAAQPTDLSANSIKSQPLAAMMTPINEGDLSALADALSNKTTPASVVAVSQQGLNAITTPATSTVPLGTESSSTPATLNVDINKPQWGDALLEQLRQRIQIQAGDKLQHAQIRLDPPELGKLEITLRMEGDKLSVQFTAAHPQLREALLAGSDRLRQDFSQNQMNLIDVSVSDGQPQHGHHSQQDTQWANGHPVTRRATAHSPVAPLTLPRHRTGFDSLV
ncbi:MAG: flagellar hook-length control protein FliK [Plesiomonas sp.]|uniref:flagellar hook-length control protein FliK n=1 Tax=Plesiomonas sp. TaxID=2486279 RepID=UPI003F2A9CAA